MGDTEKECIDCTVEPPPSEGGASRARLLCGRGRLFLNGRVSVSRPAHTPRLPPLRPPPPTTYHGCSITHMEWGQSMPTMDGSAAGPPKGGSRGSHAPHAPMCAAHHARARPHGRRRRDRRPQQQPAQQQPTPPFHLCLCVCCSGPFLFTLPVHVCSPRVLALLRTAMHTHNLGLLLIIISATTTTRGVPPTPPPTPRAAPWTRRWDLGG